ncbi:MAG: zinc-ribbon domain-containing protein [Oscillospiraceae bacterium]|nr:zinc-ribbon domain-containing protein [Oscillospiraceae bacterium]
MALIQCRNCGKEVSDKAEICPNCGERLRSKAQESTNLLCICEECGLEVPEGMEVCPNCGCPVKNGGAETQPQQVKVVGVDFNKKKFKNLIIGVVVLIAIAAGSMMLYKRSQEKKAAEELALKIEEYRENLKLATTTMLLGASDAEDAGNLIKSVWYNSIYEEDDIKTNKYTQDYWGDFYDDFNEALGNLFSDSTFQTSITDIEENQELVSSLMKELRNPPSEYEDAYDAIKIYYDAYLSFTNLVIDPTGSLTTFSSNFNDSDSATVNAYNAMKLYID